MFLVDHLMTKWIETKRLKVEPERCVRTRNRFSSCDKCTKSCPVSAISLDNGLKVADDKCTECMKCTVSCPSEALYDEKYLQYFKEMPNREMISFSCEKDRSNGSHIKLACLAQLDKSLLINAINNSQNVTIQFYEEKCWKCVKYDGNLKTTLDETINSLNSMLKESVAISFNENATVKMERSYTRRDLITFYSKKMTNNVVSPLFYEEEQVKNLRVSLQAGSRLTIFQKLLDKYHNQFLECHSAKTLNTIQLFFKENCDGCKVCSKVCPTGALKFIEDDTEMKAIFQPSLCNGCLACIDICGKKALESNLSLIELSVFLGKKEQEVLNRKFNPCSICGENHVNDTLFCEDCSIQQRRKS